LQHRSCERRHIRILFSRPTRAADFLNFEGQPVRGLDIRNMPRKLLYTLDTFVGSSHFNFSSSYLTLH
jgi:hypothetical protein